MEKTHETQQDKASKELIRESGISIADAIQHHVICDPERLTYLLFINYHSTEPSREWASRFGFTAVPARPHSNSKGRVVGGEPGTPMAIVVRAAPGTLIELPESQKPYFPSVRLGLRVTPDFGLIPEDSLVRSNADSQTSQMMYYDDELLPVFADRNLPSWLRTILDAQLNYWNKHHAETYYRFTPWPVRGEEFVRCIKAAPYWALARWKHELFPHQIDYCANRSGAAAVAFCLERIPGFRRNSFLAEHAEDALIHARHRMSEHQIILCAEKAPDTALRLRNNLPPALRARVFAHLVRLRPWDYSDLPSELKEEILESIASFPQAWLDCYGNFDSAMEMIAKRLSIQPDGPISLSLYERMDPAGKEAFLQYIVSRI
jgi:hypothetical protein